MRALLALATLGALVALPAAGEGDDGGGISVDLREIVQLESLSSDEAGKAYAFLGNVTLSVPGLFRVRAARMVVWLDPKATTNALQLVEGLQQKERFIPTWAVRALYAEGGRLPAVFHAVGRVFRCASLYYDFTQQRGLILDGQLRIDRQPVGGKPVPDLVLRARRFRSVKPGELRGEDVAAFTSDYHDPEVELRFESIVLRDEELGEAVGELMRLSAAGARTGVGLSSELLDKLLEGIRIAGLDGDGLLARFDGIRARGWGVNFFKWGSLEGEGDDLLDLRVEANVGSYGRLREGVRIAVGKRQKPLGFLVGAGYFHDRGPLLDLQLELDTLDSRVTGKTNASWMHDNGDDFGVVPPDKNRYWFQNRYRWQVDDTWRLDGELTLLSDELWLLVYDQQTAKEDKEQETLLYLRGRGETGYITLVAKTRTIDFAATLEELPRVAGELPVLTLARLGGIVIQLAGHAQLGSLRQRTAANDATPDFRTVRFHANPTVSAAFNLGPVRVVPTFVFAFSAYENTLGGGSLTRFAGTAGLRADTQLSRWYGERRHVMNFAIEYIDMYEVTEDASNFYAMDNIDRLTPFEVLSLRWRNRWQRRSEANELVEFLNIELEGAWFPEGRRPFGREGDGFVEADVEWRVSARTGVSARLQVDTGRLVVDTGSIGGWIQVNRDLRLGGAFRHLNGDSDVLTLSGEVEVDSRWDLSLFSQFDLKAGVALDQGIVIQRLGKTTVVGVRLVYDPFEDSVRLSFRVDLLELFRRKRAKDRDDLRRETIWR